MTDRGAASRLTDAAVDRLTASVTGAVLRRGDAGYDESRRVFNAMIDRHPPVVLRAADAADVVAAVRFAREHDLLVSVKGGGHSVSGHAVHDDALMLDMGDMHTTQVDPDRRLATVGPGALLADVDAATSAYGLATPTGVVSVTGIAGLTLGGGLGWLSGTHGLACDNLVGAEVVTADGDLVRTDEEQHPDLFWALRGGSGNFGVVTSFSFRLHPVDDVFAGGITYTPDTGPDALCRFDEIARSAPDGVSLLGSVWRDEPGRARLSVGVCVLETSSDAGATVEALRRLAPVEADELATVAYRDLQRSGDDGAPPGRQHYWKSGWLPAVSSETAETIFAHVARMPSQDSGVGLQQLHGAASRVSPTATAFPNRRECYDLQIVSQWPDPADTDRNIEWTRALFDALRPALDDVYVNNLGNEGQDRTRAAYGPNYDRLTEVKRRYDPSNFFRLTHNIEPANPGLRSGGVPLVTDTRRAGINHSRPRGGA